MDQKIILIEGFQNLHLFLKDSGNVFYHLLNVYL